MTPLPFLYFIKLLYCFNTSRGSPIFTSFPSCIHITVSHNSLSVEILWDTITTVRSFLAISSFMRARLSARRQAYCDGMAPYELRGKRTTCRKYAAAMGRRELAENDPIKDLYNRRRSVIRTEKNRGTITPEFAAAAYKLAKEHKFRALQDQVYAASQYSLDMEREQLYRDAEKLVE